MISNDNNLLKNEEVETKIEENSIEDEEYESSSNDDMALCLKIGLGLSGVATIGFSICKLLSSSNDEIRED